MSVVPHSSPVTTSHMTTITNGCGLPVLQVTHQLMLLTPWLINYKLIKEIIAGTNSLSSIRKIKGLASSLGTTQGYTNGDIVM